jgi:phosphoribosylformylglycinamidine synthase subunit PurSL
MLWKIRLVPTAGAESPESLRAARALKDAGADAKGLVHHRLFLIEGDIARDEAESLADRLLRDPVLESALVLPGDEPDPEGRRLFHVMRRTGVMDPVEQSLTRALRDCGITPIAVKSADQYCFATEPDNATLSKAAAAFGNIVVDDSHAGPLVLERLPRGRAYVFERREVPGLVPERVRGQRGRDRL